MTAVAQIFGEAFRHHQAGQPDEAAVLYRAVLDREPLHVDALHLLGLTRRAHYDQAGAAALIRRALAVDPGFAAAHANLAKAAAALGLTAEALAAGRRALRLSPALDGVRPVLADLLVDRGEAARARGALDEAGRLYAEADRLVPDRPEVLERLMHLHAGSDLLQALGHAERLWSLRGGAGDDVLRGNLWHLCAKAGSDAGVEECRRRLARSPSPTAWIALGNAQRQEDRGQAAEAAYRVAAALRPGEPFAYGRLACLLIEHGRLAEADRLLCRVARCWTGREEVMRFDPAFVSALGRGREPRPLPPGRYLDVDKPVLVLTGCDGRYFERFAAALIHSTVRNAGLACTFHLHVVNPPADLAGRVEHFEERLGRPGIGFSTGIIDAAALGDGVKTVYACERFLVLPTLLRRYRRTVLMLDTDLIVLRGLQRLLASVEGADVGLVGGAHNRFEPWNLFWADVMVIRPTERAIAYFDRVAAYLAHFLERGLPRWFLDQIALHAVYAGGFEDEVPPRLVLFPKDIHRMAIIYTADGDAEPPDGCLFWSARASTVDPRLTLDMPRFRQYLL